MNGPASDQAFVPQERPYEERAGEAVHPPALFSAAEAAGDFLIQRSLPSGAWRVMSGQGFAAFFDAIPTFERLRTSFPPKVRLRIIGRDDRNVWRLFYEDRGTAQDTQSDLTPPQNDADIRPHDDGTDDA